MSRTGALGGAIAGAAIAGAAALLSSCGPATPPPSPPQATASASAHASPAVTARKRRAGPRKPFEGPFGEVASLAGARVKIVLPSGETRVVEPEQLHPAPGNRALFGISPTELLYLEDGSLLVGEGDGSVTWLDEAGRRTRSIGFRGAITGLAPAGEGRFAVTTKRGVMALVTEDGKVRWEQQVTGERLGPAAVTADHTLIAASARGVFALSERGDLVFSHAAPELAPRCGQNGVKCPPDAPIAVRIDGDTVVVESRNFKFRLGDPHPAVASLVPTFALTFRRELGESVLSVVKMGDKGLAALVKSGEILSDYDWSRDVRHDVVLLGDGKPVWVDVPGKMKKEVFLDGTKADESPLFADSLVLGPNGNPWLLSRRMSPERTESMDSLLSLFVGAGQIHEVVNRDLRERTDLFKHFREHDLSMPMAAAPEGQAGVICFGRPEPACAIYKGTKARVVAAPAPVSEVHRVGKSDWLLSREKVYAVGEKAITEVLPGAPGIVHFGGVSENDVWADGGVPHMVYRFDGKTWAPVSVPGDPGVFFARASDDVWSGRSRWDGKAWSFAFGAPPAVAVLARGKDDVWLGDPTGLWHGTAPGPAVVRLPAAAQDEGPITAPPALPLGPAEARYSVEPATFEQKGIGTVTAARNIAAAPDGTLWLLRRWDVLEVDDKGQATVLSRTGADSFGRWALAEASGLGTLLLGGEVQRQRDGKAKAEEMQLDAQDVAAVHGIAGGATWIVASPARFYPEDIWADHSPHALVRPAKDAALQPVLGLPAAAWCDVAATSDGGAWFAGGLNRGPSGEGILFHAKGRLGSEKAARFRAQATLLAVSAAGPDEAWAAGAGGTVIHVQGASVTRMAVASGEWQRAVLVVAPDDVWIGGDGGTLLHYDGREFRAVTNPLGPQAAITGLAAARGAIWAVGPTGILRIAKKP